MQQFMVIPPILWQRHGGRLFFFLSERVPLPLRLICVHSTITTTTEGRGNTKTECGRTEKQAPSSDREIQERNSSISSSSIPPHSMSYHEKVSSPSKAGYGRLSYLPYKLRRVHFFSAQAFYYIKSPCKILCSPERSHIIANCCINIISW